MTEFRNMGALSRAIDTWFICYAALLCYWEIAEAVAPSRQYPDPAWPCAYCASVVFPLVFALVEVVVTYRRPDNPESAGAP